MWFKNMLYSHIQTKITKQTKNIQEIGRIYDANADPTDECFETLSLKNFIM